MEKRQEKVVIGPSTGWLYARNLMAVEAHERVLRSAGATCFEICLSGWNENDLRLQSLQEATFNDVYAYRSLHLPDFDAGIGVPEQLSVASRLTTHHRIAAAVMHPLRVAGEYPRHFYEQMLAAGVPLAFENMDHNKTSGFVLSDLEALLRLPGSRFVLDLQHAYEHDPSMKYAEDIFGAVHPALSHLHVSGESDMASHSLVHKARNAKAVVDFLATVMARHPVPIVLEGFYETWEDLFQEIVFLRRELGL
ncbi:MAG: hypothetical protein Q7R83_03925 [bacterium]|nr:hypothetical protein [bacterium]